MGDVIDVEHDAAVCRADVEAAVGLWRSCSGYGEDFPSFAVGGRDGFRRIQIVLAPPSAVTLECGTFRGNTITLHTEARDAKGRPVDCGPLSQNLAHELGHVLGLGHLPDRERCRTHIMGVVTRDSANGRWVSPEECAAAGARWRTAKETPASSR